MDWLIPCAMVLGGLVLLAVAADRFVVAAARLSRVWGVSPIVIGALVIGMGTSAPELLVSILAATAGELDLAIGNAVGSNVANVTLVLGVTALFVPLTGSLRVLRREGLLMFFAVSALALALWDLRLSRIEGIGLSVMMFVSMYLVLRWARMDKVNRSSTEQSPDGSDQAGPEISWKREVGFGLLSMAVTLLGAELLVRGGVTLATRAGVSSAFIGMTLVAVGTSVPELATSLAGIRRKEHDLVLGNVLGSNLFNALAVAGVAGFIAPGATNPSFRLAGIAMVACAALAGVLAFTGRQLVRWEGMVLLSGFVGFVYLTYVLNT